MKRKNCISQAYIRRDAVILPELFDLAKACSPFPTTMLDICRLVADMPVNEYFLSEDAALAYVRKRWRNNKDCHFVNPYKQKLYNSLYDLVVSMMAKEHYRKLGLRMVTAIALTRPAPCIGMTPEVIMLKVYEYIKKTRKKCKNSD